MARVTASDELMFDIVNIWGTGWAAEQLMNYIEYLNHCCKETFGYDGWRICYFIDNDPQKHGRIFHGVRIISPYEFAWHTNCDPLIVAVVNDEEIQKYLTGVIGAKQRIIYSLCEVVEGQILLRQRLSDILARINSLFMDSKPFSEKCLDFIRRIRYFTEIRADYRCLAKQLYNSLCLLHISPNFLFILKCAYVCEYINIVKQTTGTLPPVTEMVTDFDETSVMSGIIGLYQYCNSDEITNFLYNILCVHSVHKSNKQHDSNTVAIYYPVYSNGGVERVLSLLMPIFIQCGYRIIFFTDNYEVDTEYDCPPEIVRIVLPNRMYNFLSWCQMLNECMNKYDVQTIYFPLYLDTKLLLCFRLLATIHETVFLCGVHSSFVSFTYRKLNLRYYAALYRTADVLLVLSKADEAFWRIFSCNALYLPNPIPLPKEQQILSNEYDPNMILWVGRIMRETKNIFDVVEVMKYLRNMCPDAVLHIVGRSYHKSVQDELESTIKSAGLEGSIVFEGYHSDVSSYYKKAAVMIMTSSYEGFPMVVAESKSFGVPLVLYDLPYVELLKDTRGYCKVSPRDCASMATNVAAILKNSTLRRQMSMDAKDSLHEFLDYDQVAAWKSLLDLKPNRYFTVNKENDKQYPLIVQTLENAFYDVMQLT